MTTKGYTFTPESYTAQSSGRKYNFTPEDAVGKGHVAEEEEEGFWKSAARTALQVPQGLLEATKPGIAAGLFQLAALGESDLDVEDWHRVRKAFEDKDETFDDDAYEQGRQQMLGMIPTVSNIAGKIEEETGLPLEPKTKEQKFLRLGSTAYKFQPGTTGQKLTAGVAAPAVSHGLQATGLPEVFSEPLGLLAGVPVGAKGPKFDIGQAKKPSGLTTRQFEGISKPTEVPAKKIQQINDKLEKDFKGISDKIIKDSPIGETAKNLAEDPAFKQESRELLNQAQEIADATPGTIPSKAIKKEYADIAVKNTKGFALDEFDKSYLKFMKEANESILGKDVTNGQLVEMYRKNNKGLSEYFEPGSSKALNRAKKDALLDQNRAIANLIEKSNPELSKVFKDGNQRWTKIMDAEAVDGFISEIFPEGGKVNYKKAQDLFDKNGYDRIFKRALGDEGYKAFEQLTKDMLTSEAPYKMLRVAKEKGWGDFYKTASSYIIHPHLGKAKLGLDLLRSGYKGIMNAMLDEPKFALTWKKAVQDLKKGDFAASQKGFETLDKEVKLVKPEVLPKEEMKASPKKSETIEANVEKIEEPKQLEAHKKQIEHKESLKTPEKIKPIHEMTTKEAKEKLKELHDFERSILEPKVGKEVYEGLFENQGFEGQQRFWEKYEDKFTEKEIKSFESHPYTSEELRSRIDLTRDIKTSYNMAETPQESLNSVIEEIRNELVNPNIEKNKSKIKEAFDFLKDKGHTKSEIKESVVNVIGKNFKQSDAELILTDLFKLKEKPKTKTPAQLAEEKRPAKRPVDEVIAEMDRLYPETKKKTSTPKVKTKTELDKLQDQLKLAEEKYLQRKKEYLDSEGTRFEDLRSKQLDAAEKRLEELDNAIEEELKSFEFKKDLEKYKLKTKQKPAETLPESKVKEVKRQDISKKGLKEQKNWLIEQLDKAIEKAPEGPKNPKDEGFWGKELKEKMKETYEPYKLLTFDVPGDGVMKIRNYKKALEQFRKSVDKKWPTGVNPKKSR